LAYAPNHCRGQMDVIDYSLMSEKTPNWKAQRPRFAWSAAAMC
jgi:hypothetical protein